MKAMVCLSDSDTDFLDFVVGVLQGDTLPPFIFIISLDYILEMSINLMKEDSFILKKQEVNDIQQKLLLM